MNEKQRETLKFYTTNDYLLINGLLWQEKEEVIDEFIKLINEDGRGVMKEAEEIGFAKRWDCTEEEGKRLYNVYKKRFPIIESKEIRDQILARAREDIDNMFSCLKPLEEELVLYRNIKNKYVTDLKENEVINYKGFSSCSLEPHIAENAMYGSSNCTLFRIHVGKGTPVIRMDQYENVGNEPDEVILPPVRLKITKVTEKEIQAVV